MIESHDSADESSEPRQAGRTTSDEEQREKLQRQLDEALEDSFPASDPVSIVTSHQEEDWDPPESK